MSSHGSVDRAPARCLGGHGFDSCLGRFSFFHACVMLINLPFTQSGIFLLAQTNKCPVSWQWVKNGWQIPQKRFLYSSFSSSPAESPSEPDSISRLFFTFLFFGAAFLLGRLLLY